PCPERTKPEPVNRGQPLGAIPRTQEQAAVLSWIFEHRPEATELEFLSWSAPREVADNPFSHGPATLVKLLVKNRDASEERLEQLSFYLCDVEVLGGISEPYQKIKTAVCV